MKNKATISEVFEGKQGCHLVISSNDKVLRQGIFDRAEAEDYHIKVYIDDQRTKDKFYEIPHPFDIRKVKDNYNFDYKMNKLGLDVEGIMTVNQLLNENKSKNKFIGRTITLTFTQPLK